MEIPNKMDIRMSENFDFFSKIFRQEIEEFMSNEIKDYPDLTEQIKKIIPEYQLEFVNLNNNSDCCVARVFKNGQESRCSVKKKKGEFCGRHFKDNKYGRIYDKIPEEYQKKFIKRLDINPNQISKTIQINIESLGNNVNIQFKSIEINNKTYLSKQSGEDIFIYSDKKDNPILLGKYEFGYIIGI